MSEFGSKDSSGAIRRKREFMKEARYQWPFLTEYDLSSIETEGQLRSLVKIRSNISVEKAEKDVRVWMRGKRI